MCDYVMVKTVVGSRGCGNGMNTLHLSYILQGTSWCTSLLNPIKFNIEYILITFFEQFLDLLLVQEHYIAIQISDYIDCGTKM